VKPSRKEGRRSGMVPPGGSSMKYRLVFREPAV